MCDDLGISDEELEEMRLQLNQDMQRIDDMLGIEGLLLELDYPALDDALQKIGEEIDELMGHVLREQGLDCFGLGEIDTDLDTDLDTDD